MKETKQNFIGIVYGCRAFLFSLFMEETDTLCILRSLIFPHNF